ncbi:BTB/POZ domain-containing protein At5g17580-like [Argentina anserina]|uniref:BTB/POZ domain-containing protein At5g17580-like n=1 Tax=Argentina anserina TaxID=57926 RepID=UPI0021763741|nr:BTB/POZ domain-containing protein At5g17580-like [Potentilla anserina]
MEKERSKDTSLLWSLPKSAPDLQLNVRGGQRSQPLTMDKELLAAKSAKFAARLKENPQEDLSNFFQSVPANPETIELVARFYHGFELQICSQNVVQLICVADYLEMTENHSKDNLLNKAVSYFHQRILPSWSEAIKALRSTEQLFQQALKLGLVGDCLESIVRMAKASPQLLGEPIKNSTASVDDSDEEYEVYKPNARRRLFDFDWKSEDLTTLSLQLYEPLMHGMNKHGVPQQYLAASLCNYTNKWVFCGSGDEARKKWYQKDILEAVERLFPDEIGLLPCTFLFQMLRHAIYLEVTSDCRNGIEIRIGKQLDQATVQDLLIPSQGYSKVLQYDIQCVRRIVKVFYANYASSNVSDVIGLIAVADLIEEFLAEVASDIDLKISTFVGLAEMLISASMGVKTNSDGVYRAVTIYLDAHKHMTKSEREEVCQVLDFQKMSPQACDHAAKNECLPLRTVVQVLFAGQLQLRDTIMKEVQTADDKLIRPETDEVIAPKLEMREGKMKSEVEKMSKKVMQLERQCSVIRKEIENSSSLMVRKEKTSLWREMKRKFGCISSFHDSNCQLKKKRLPPKLGG